MSIFDRDTICALSTVQGVGAIAVVRVSGPLAIEVVDQLFKPFKGVPLRETPSHRIRYGEIVRRAAAQGASAEAANGEVLDQVIAAVYRAPHSYTGEEMVELSLHGSLYIQQEMLLLLVENGARLAGPGEFSQRAFLNGRMDLAQAEAVADLIASESRAAHQIAIRQMKGGFSKELAEMRASLLEVVSLMELELDFAEEDVEFADRDHLKELVEKVIVHCDQLVDSFKLGNAIKNGIPVAIAGATNTGKSTLLNLLLKEERSIVSDIHGTTRDYIEEYINLRGIGFRFIDTAGIRESKETIELIGMERSYEKIKEATLVLLLLDAERPQFFEQGIAKIATLLADDPKQVVVLLNKCDVVSTDQESEMLSEIELLSQKLFPKGGVGENLYSLLPFSAKEGRGVEELIEILLKSGVTLEEGSHSTLLTNVRHWEALKNATISLERVVIGLEEEIPTDLVSQDIREALFYIGQIVGEINTEEVLGNIFANFCIGK